MSDLVQLAKQFQRQRLTPNPRPDDDHATRLNEFCMVMKAEGHRLVEWDEEQWFLACYAIGIPSDQVGGLMENVSSWGVDD